MMSSNVTQGPKHHYFGYYDKCPWDKAGRYLLGMETGFIDHSPDPAEKLVIGMGDTHKDNLWTPLGSTGAWNWQQGTMLQWLGGNDDNLVIYNDRRGDKFVSVIYDVSDGREKKVLPLPVYTLSHDGKSALSLNFARVHKTRPGYGYPGLDTFEKIQAPAGDGIYRMDLETGENTLIISLADIVKIGHDAPMDDAVHWFNHLLFNPSDSRFTFLHRWQSTKNNTWNTRFFTADSDGGNIHCVANDGMVSHFDWRDDNRILAWARQKEIGDYYFLFTDQSGEKEIVGENILTCDGHCSYSPDRRWILTDTYPNEKSMRMLILFDTQNNRRIDIGEFFSPPELTGEWRCDLHPRWNRDGTKICIDSAHEETRQIYVIDVKDIIA